MPSTRQPSSDSPERPRRSREAVFAASDYAVDPEEVGRLRTEVERLRNDLYLANAEALRARREGRVEIGTRVVETLGHDVRTSLTLVLGWTELIVGGKLPPEEVSRALDAVYAAGWRVEASIRWLERVVERETRPPDGDGAASPPVEDSDFQLARSP